MIKGVISQNLHTHTNINIYIYIYICKGSLVKNNNDFLTFMKNIKGVDGSSKFISCNKIPLLVIIDNFFGFLESFDGTTHIQLSKKIIMTS